MRTGFIGGGKMAEALLSALLARDVCPPEALAVSDVDATRADQLRERYGIETGQDNRRVARRSEAVVLAVKPQDLEAVLDALGDACDGRLVVSIAAGRRLAFFETRLPGARLVRVMPNLACQVGQGMSAYCGGAGATDADLAFVRRMLECCGKTVFLEESFFDTVTALSGSGPAFLAYVAQALADTAVDRGLPPETAMLLMLQTMAGTAAVLLETGMTPAALMANVASKGGTTAAGLAVLEQSPLRDILQATLAAAADRSITLGRQCV